MDTVQLQALLPCPFCGAVARFGVDAENMEVWVECTNAFCDATSATISWDGHTDFDREGAFREAARRWNRRVVGLE